MEWCKHVTDDFIFEHPKGTSCPSDEELKQQWRWFMEFIQYRKEHPKKPGEEGYEFWKHYQ